MRGERGFNEIIKSGGIEKAARRGRNNALLNRRNECMIARYYYYGYIRNKGYEETMKLLVLEFFISMATIANVVQEHMEQVHQLKHRAPTVFYFCNRWPHMKW